MARLELFFSLLIIFHSFFITFRKLIRAWPFAPSHNLVALLRMKLFTHRDLMAWLDKPFATLPDPQDSPQAVLAFA